MEFEDGFMFPDGTPQEIKDAVKARHENAQLQHLSQHHEAIRLLTELSAEQQLNLRHLLGEIGSVEDPSARANYYEGLVSGLLQSRGVCLYCEIDHGEEALRQMAELDSNSDGSSER